MKSIGCLNTCSGQALVETLFSLPILVAGVTLVLGGLHSLSAFYLTDFWSYNMALCLNKEISSTKCRTEFNKKTSYLPFAKVEVLATNIGSRKSQTKVILNTPLLHNQMIENTMSKKLTSRSFLK